MALSRAARLLSSFATAVLDLGLPSIREWLRGRIGPDADVASATVEGSLVHLAGVRVPIGPRGILSLERATFSMAARRGVGMPELSLKGFRGTLRFGQDGDLAFAAPVSFRGDADAGGDAWASGTLSIGGATWTQTEGVSRQKPLHGEARLRVTMAEWALERGELGFGDEGAKVVRFGASGGMDADGLAEARLAVAGARAGHFVDAVAALVGQRLEARVPLPFDARIDADVAWDKETGGRGELRARTEATEIVASGEVRADGALRATIDATLGAAEWAARAGVPPVWRPSEEGRVRARATLGGTVTRWEARGEVEASALVFRLGGARYVPGETASSLSLAIEAGPDAAEIRGSVAIGGGTVETRAERRGGSTRLELRAARIGGATLARALRAGGVLDPFDVPADAALSGTLVHEAGTVRGALTLETPRSSLAIDPAIVSRGRLDGTRLQGSVAVEDLLLAGLLPPGDVRLEPPGAIAGDLALSGPLEDARVAGRVRSAKVTLVAAAVAAPLVLEDASGEIDVSRAAVRYRDVSARALEGRVRASGAVDLAETTGAPRMALHFDACRVAPLLAPAIAAPAFATATGEAVVAQDLATSAAAAIETPRGTALMVELRLSPAGALDGSTARGRVALVDALAAAGSPSLPVSFDREAFVTVDAGLRGDLDRPIVSGGLRAAELRFTSGAATFAVTDVSTLFAADRARVVWHKLVARAYGGRVSSAGMVGVAPPFEGMKATVACDDVALGLVPLAADLVRGRLFASVRLERQGGAGAIEGSGHLRLEDPEYPAIERAAPELARFGLPTPSIAGTAAARALVRIDAGGIGVTEISAKVPAAALAGQVWIGHDQRLRGALRLQVAESWLAKSPWLRVPGWLAGDVEVPLSLRGTLASPDVGGELWATLERLLAKNRVTDAFAHVASEIASVITGEPRVRHERAAPEVEGPPPEEPDDAVVRRMIEDGADWDEIEMELERRRARGVPPSRVRVG